MPHINVNVDIDIADVFDQITDYELVKEMQHRCLDDYFVNEGDYSGLTDDEKDYICELLLLQNMEITDPEYTFVAELYHKLYKGSK